MFATDLHELTASVARWSSSFDPAGMTPSQVAATVTDAARLEKLAAGIRLRSARYLGDKVTDSNGQAKDRDEWLAGTTGKSKTDAGKDVETSEQLASLPNTDQAIKNGELSSEQAREVASASTDDPGRESELLDTARKQSLPELKRRAKQVRAAATDDAEKNRRAHRDRDVASGTDDETAMGWIHIKGPAAVIAQLLAFLSPFAKAEFDKARREGRHERQGAYAFDGLVALFKAAAAGRTADGCTVGPPAKLIVRVDAAALKRGHTVAGEVCEIDGIGPVPLAAIRELLPQATIDVIVTDGEDVFNVTNLRRRSNAHQQVVLWWLGGQCTREGCPNTHDLQVDHRIDWATTHVTELKALDWLCKQDHDLKTYDGWALVHGRGRRRMVPPDDPDHPANQAADRAA